MSKKHVNVSKDDILNFAREIYKQAICGYSDLEDSVCISETNKFFDGFLKVQNDPTTSNLTVSSNIYDGNSVIWTTVPSQGSYYVGCDPYFSTLPPYSLHTNEGFSDPADRQLLLFDSTNSSSSVVDLSESFDNVAGDESPPSRIDSNEGHVFHNF